MQQTDNSSSPQSYTTKKVIRIYSTKSNTRCFMTMAGLESDHGHYIKNLSYLWFYVIYPLRISVNAQPFLTDSGWGKILGLEYQFLSFVGKKSAHCRQRSASSPVVGIKHTHFWPDSVWILPIRKCKFSLHLGSIMITYFTNTLHLKHLIRFFIQ